MKKFELPEQPQKTNTSNDFTVAREAITNLDKFDYAWKTYSHKLEKRFTAAIKYIEEIERENQRLRAENLAVKTLVGDAKKQQPEIPEFVAEVFSDNDTFRPASKMDIISWFTGRNSDPEWDKVCLWARENEEQFIQYVLNFKPVAKEKRFYLKDNRELESVGNTCIGYVTLYLKNDGYLTTNETRAGKFSQQEIDSMAADSYEQIEVGE